MQRSNFCSLELTFAALLAPACSLLSRAVVEKELDNICGEILELLDKYLVPSATTTEAAVFYLKMKADYHRYLSEYKTQELKESSAEVTLSAYKEAQTKADELPSTNPIR